MDQLCSGYMDNCRSTLYQLCSEEVERAVQCWLTSLRYCVCFVKTLGVAKLSTQEMFVSFSEGTLQISSTQRKQKQLETRPKILDF